MEKIVHKNELARNVGLDLIRATAIIVVIASHIFWAFLPPVEKTVLLWSGEAGVELFFSLSGFLIGSILITAAQTDFGPHEAGVFLFRRWMRTLPIYYVALWIHSWFLVLRTFMLICFSKIFIQMNRDQWLYLGLW